MLVAGGDELGEQIRGVLFEWQAANLVDDDQSVTPQLGESHTTASAERRLEFDALGQRREPLDGGAPQ